MHASATSVRHAPGFVGFDVFHVDPFGLGGFLREFDRQESMVADIDILKFLLRIHKRKPAKRATRGLAYSSKLVDVILGVQSST